MIDPNTGQTVFDQRYAAFLDPAQMAQVQAQQGQAGQLGQLGQEMMNKGYIPNSGFGGALAQMLQAFTGMKMLNKSKEEMQQASQAQLEAAKQAALAERAAKREDTKFMTDEEIRKAGGTDEAKKKVDLQYADQTSSAEAKAAAAKAQALLPTEAQKIQLETQGKIAAATAAAEVGNRRGYVVADASGNQHVITPQGKEIYQATSPGGGKLTPTQQELNKVDVNKLEQLQVRNQAAQQLQGNLNNWAANYLQVDPNTLQGKSKEEIAKMIQSVPVTHAMAVSLNPNMGGLDAISNDIGINAAGTKRATPTDSIIAAEQANTLSRGNMPAKNASIFLNHMRDIESLQKDIKETTGSVSSRQAPGTGAVPMASPGPTNPAPQVHYVYDPASGKLIPQS
jgi:hypothetical protein